MATEINATLQPPGRAQIFPCPDCSEGLDEDTQTCAECEGTGRQLWRACPSCGDIGFDYINGHDETGGMHCRLGCGHRWTAHDPAWLIQRLL